MAHVHMNDIGYDLGKRYFEHPSRINDFPATSCVKFEHGLVKLGKINGPLHPLAVHPGLECRPLHIH